MEKILGGRGIVAIATGAILTSGVAMSAEIELITGETIDGVITHRDADQVVVEHLALGRLVIPADRVVSFEEDIRLAAVQDEAAPTPQEAKWKSKFILGAGGTAGNSDDQSANVVITSTRKTEEIRTTFDTGYRWAASDGDRTANRFTIGLLNDWLLPGSPWLYFATARFDIDEFQSWDERLAVHGGVGYQLYDEENFELVLRAGLGAIKEWGSANEDWRPEALLGGDLIWRISDQQTFRAGTTIYPDLDDTGEFRTFSYADWSAVMDADSNMSLVARVEHEHQSVVNPGFDKNDYRFSVGLQFDF